jgi:hypothetical protein
MKCLTIQEPWAWAIVDLAAEGNAAAKCVENRGTGFPRYTGPMAIHSGAGATYCDLWAALEIEILRKTKRDVPPWSEIRGRGIVGVCNVVASVTTPLHLMDDLRETLAFLCQAGWHVTTPLPLMDDLRERVERACEEAGVSYDAAELWIEGPRCLILRDVVRLPNPIPIPIRGMQGLWNVEPKLILPELEKVADPAVYGLDRPLMDETRRE